MKNKILLLFAIISVCLSTNAQIKIDFSNGTGNKAYVSDGYTDWYIDEIEKNKYDDKEFDGDGVTIKISHGSDTQADIIKRSWYETGLKSGTEETKLVCDGIYACLEEDNASYGDGQFGATSERVAIDVTISGLEVGKYSLLAYHNYVMNASHTLPAIGVEVDGTVIKSGIQQTQQILTKADAAYSLVNFEVTEAGNDVVVTYFSEPEDGESYTRTYFFINSLELSSSVVGPDDKISNSYPTNLDYHVEAENGLTLTWDAPNNGADSYTVYFDTDEEAVTNGIAASETLQTTSFTKTGLSPLNRYYWRVDVVRDDVTYKGEVWSFQPRRDAFPGAEGYGRYAIGGRGWKGNGKVYHVTSLKDDGSEGTFRYGIENATVPTTIVFDVSGVIHLQSRLTNSNPYVTIAGQTAPGNGIMFRGAPLGVASDGITRFVRLRRGDIVEDGTTITITLEKEDENGNKVKYDKEVPADCGKGLDGMGMAGNDHSIIDHCSIGWTVDEAFSSRNAKNITLQHTLISEALNIAGHPNYDAGTGHGYAATIGGDKGSYHHNLLAHNAGRNWSMGGGLDGAGAYAGKADMFNNVCYNWTTRTTDGGVHNGQFVNNYYKMGPASTHTLLFTAELEGAGSGTQEYYVNGNIRQAKDNGAETTHSYKAEGDGNIYKYELSGGQVLDWTVFVNKPYFDSWATIETAKAAFKNVLSDVGCNYAGLDNHDVRMVSETLHGTTSTTGSKGELAGIIDATTDRGCEGFDGLNIETATRPDNWDSDGDGIPAWFETAMGWSDSSANNNVDNDGDYYTDLEEYLNWVAVPHFYNTNDGTVTALETGTNHTITLADYFAGYTSPTYAVVSDGGATTSISDGVLTYNFPASSSKLVTIQVKATQDGISLTRSFNFFIDASDVEVTPEGTEYMIAKSTNTGNNTTSSYEFKSEGVTFTVTNTKSKGYSAGNEDGVKYSAGVQYTITIPEGCSVNGIKFSGYNNYDETDAYIGEVNGTTYESTEYVFPMKDGEGNSTSKEYTIHFADPVTNSLTFTPQDRQCVWAITLYATGTPAVTPDDDTELAPAFPGAEGSGRYAQGGRGTNGTTNVYHVTSLADDGSEGTLRWALAQTEPRTIVFDVSGYIDLASDLKIPSNTTIAGQTAPAPGITLRYYTVNTSDAENVIIRYMRFRRSQVKDVNDGADAAWGRHGNNIILDHCSFSWSIDEVASFYDNRDFTMQWCVVAEGLNSGHEKGTHSYGGIWGGKNATFHHNMITNVHNRAPRLCGARFNWDGYDTEAYDHSVQAERVDVRNNLYYNWGQGNGAYGGAGGYHNLVNNYYKDGPGTKNKSRVFQGSTNTAEDSESHGLPDGLPGLFYINGNYVTAADSPENYDWQGVIYDEGTGVDKNAWTYTDSHGLYGTAGETVSIKLDKEVDMADVTTHTAANAYDKILVYGGASLYRDAVDKRLMSDTESGEATYPTTSDANSTPGIVDVISDPAAAAVAGQPSFPMLAVVERPANWDTDLDGIPDAWEEANGLNKNSAADGNLYTLDSEKTWYTNLEVYLNSIVEEITKAQTEGATIEIDEYYPDWTKPTAESLTEFVLSNETHSYGSANVWTFSNGFGVTGDADRKYANTSDYIKYSNGYEYTISVPSNVTVSRVKIEGYSNTAVGGDKAYLATLGTQTFDATKYVFPNSDASVYRASYEFSLPETVTGGTIAIKAAGAQACLIVTLYGTKEGVTLDDKENEITIPGGESSETGTIKWAMTTGEKEDAIYTNITSEGFNGTGDITLQNVDYNGTVTIQSKEYTETQFRPTKTDENNIIDFIVTLNDGYTFTPTKVEFIATRVGTNAGTLTASFNNNNIFNELGSFTPNRNKDYNSNNETIDASPYYTKGEYNITNVEDITETFGVRFQLDGVATNKDYALCNIIIHGTLKHNVVTTVTLDEMATVHDLEAADNVTVEMKRGLTAGAWNTFCVPFNLTKTELEAALDDDVEVVKYTKQEGTTLHFENIKDTEEMLAGTPYLIKPASFNRTYDECKKTPITFKGVYLEAANMKSNSRDVAGKVRPSAADYSFVGTYVRYIMETDGTELGLNSKNKLAKPAASTNIMRGLRGFFRYNAGNGAGAKVVINGTLTSIDEIDGGTAGAKGVYHVSGRYVRSEWDNGSGLPRGLYIVDGQKMVK